MLSLDPYLQLDRPLRTEAQARADRLARIRKDYRRAWSRFWMLQEENLFHRPSWRVEAEQRAYGAMRDVVREYARARGWEVRRAA